MEIFVERIAIIKDRILPEFEENITIRENSLWNRYTWYITVLQEKVTYKEK